LSLYIRFHSIETLILNICGDRKDYIHNSIDFRVFKGPEALADLSQGGHFFGLCFT
jgi:hypothetical protein